MKQFFLVLLLSIVLISCEQQEIGLRDDVKSENLVGSWLDIGQMSPLGPVNSSTKGGIFLINSDGTYQTQCETPIMGFDSRGNWLFDPQSNKIIFESDFQYPTGFEQIKIENYWIIKNFENNILEVSHKRYRKQQNILNPLTNEIVEVVDSVNIQEDRRFEKQQ